MRRGAFKVVVFLLLGTIVNVAVAWGFSSIAMVKSERLLEPAEIRWLMARQNAVDWGQHPNIQAIESRQIGHRRIVISDPRLPFLMLLKAGWPYESVYHESVLGPSYPPSWVAYGIGQPGTRISYSDCLIHIVTIPESEVIPLNLLSLSTRSVIWPGFAINTMFYAGLLWVVFLAPGKVRRMVRSRRGLCPACAYDLRGSTSPVCTECGGSVKGKRIEHIVLHTECLDLRSPAESPSNE